MKFWARIVGWTARILLRRKAANRREIYRYWDGSEYRYADPMVILHRLHRHPEFAIDRDIQLAGTGDLDAMSRCVDAARDAFDVKPLQKDGSGLTAEETIDLFESFAEWQESLKKTTRPTRTGPQATASRVA